MKKVLFDLTCKECRKIFRSDNPNETKCPSCLKASSAASAGVAAKHKRKHDVLTFSNIGYLCNKYYVRNRRSISYGHMTSMIRECPNRCCVCDVQLTDKNRANTLGEYICNECNKL